MMCFINSISQFCNLFYRQQKGVALFEFAFSIFAFSMVCYLLVDLGSAFVTQGRLERTTFALASTLRERASLYNGNELITEDNVKQLKQLADTLLPGNSAIRVEAIYFEEKQSSQKIKQQQRIDVGDIKMQQCRSQLPALQTISALAPQSNLRWMPIYRVTLCRPSEKSWFKSLVNPGRGYNQVVVEELMASMVVLPR